MFIDTSMAAALKMNPPHHLHANCIEKETLAGLNGDMGTTYSEGNDKSGGKEALSIKRASGRCSRQTRRRWKRFFMDNAPLRSGGLAMAPGLRHLPSSALCCTI